MIEPVAQTFINQTQVSTPLLIANEVKLGNLSLDNVDNIQAKTGYIENLTIKELTVLDEEVEGADAGSESYDEVEFNDITLSFGDDCNNRYLIATHDVLVSNEDGKVLEIKFDTPTEMGSKLVCRYLVVDLRELDETVNVGVIWPTQTIKWLYGVPDIQAGYFYVLAFQRFAKDLIVGNVAVKIEG